jgi:uncharacterized protein YkwD
LAAKNENRCWPGYEPVKGKPAHSEGSCRPKAESKTTAAEKNFRTKRKKQLDEWQEDHPKARRSAAQHLNSPTATAKKKATKKKSVTKRKTTAKRARYDAPPIIAL